MSALPEGQRREYVHGGALALTTVSLSARLRFNRSEWRAFLVLPGLLVVATLGSRRPNGGVDRLSLLTRLGGYLRRRSTRRLLLLLSGMRGKGARSPSLGLLGLRGRQFLAGGVWVELSGHRLRWRLKRALPSGNLVHEVLDGLALRVHGDVCPGGIACTVHGRRLRGYRLALALLWWARESIEGRDEVKHRPATRRRRALLIRLIQGHLRKFGRLHRLAWSIGFGGVEFALRMRLRIGIRWQISRRRAA